MCSPTGGKCRVSIRKDNDKCTHGPVQSTSILYSIICCETLHCQVHNLCIIRSQYFKDENMETLERAAEEKQKIHASMKEADERVKEMASTIAALKVCDTYTHDLVLTL